MINYFEAKEDMGARNEQITDLQTLHIGLLIENNTDQPVFVSDIAKGSSSCYIAPHSCISISLPNPVNAQYRVSNVYVLDPMASGEFLARHEPQETAYVTVVAESKLEKTDVDFEDDDCWVIIEYAYEPNGGKIAPQEDYIKNILRIDKETFEESFLSYNDLTQLRAKKKAAEKREKQDKRQ